MTRNGKVTLALICLLLWGLWWGGGVMHTALSTQPVKALSAKGITPTAFGDQRAIYPVWVKQKADIKPEDGQPIDPAFRPMQVEKEHLPPPEPDYGAQLKSQLRLDATDVPGGGAFISGQYYKRGESIESAQYQRANGAMVVPHLTTVGPNYAVITHEGKSVRLMMKDLQW